MKTNPSSQIRMLGVDDVRETNELKLLHIIRDRQPISRVDLVKATGLRAGTVSVIVNRLLRASVVHEGELAPSSGGRPATYLQINAEKAYVVGISIGVHQTVYGVSDFNGRILNQRTVRTEANGETFLSDLGEDIASQLKAPFRRGRLTGVGVSVPGLVRTVALFDPLILNGATCPLPLSSNASSISPSMLKMTPMQLRFLNFGTDQWMCGQPIACCSS
jgi:hypothetical protein